MKTELANPIPGTVQHAIAQIRQQFRALSYSRQTTLRREAAAFIRANPGCADNSNFWRGLSARQITQI